MKVYSKKNFFIGLLLAVYASAMLLHGVRSGFPPLQLGLPVMWLALAGGWIFRSLSKERAKRDILEERDERNRHIKLNAGQRALQITQILCFIGGMALYGLGGDDSKYLMLGSGLFLAFFISALAELAAAIWYEHRI